MLVGPSSSQHGSQLPQRSSALSDFKFTTIGQPPALLQRLEIAPQDLRYHSPSPLSFTSQLHSVQEPPLGRKSLLEVLGDQNDATDSSPGLVSAPARLVQQEVDSSLLMQMPQDPPLVPPPQVTASAVNVEPVLTGPVSAALPGPSSMPAMNGIVGSTVQPHGCAPAADHDSSLVQEPSLLFRSSPSPDLFTFLSQLTQEQAEWDEIRALKEKYQDEYKELLLRKDETKRALQKEIDQDTKVSALAESAVEKMEALRIKQEQRLSSERQRAESLAAEAAKLLEEKNKAEAQRTLDEQRRIAAENQAAEQRRQAEAAALAAAVEQERMKKLEEERQAVEEGRRRKRHEEERRRKCEEEERLKREEEDRRKREIADILKREEENRRKREEEDKRKAEEAARIEAQEQEAAFAKAEEERRLRERAAEEKEKLVQQALRKAEVMEQKKKAAAENAARSRTAQVKARLEKEKNEARLQLLPSPSSTSKPADQMPHVDSASAKVAVVKAHNDQPPLGGVQSGGVKLAASTLPNLATTQPSLPARPAGDVPQAEPTEPSENKTQRRVVQPVSENGSSAKFNNVVSSPGSAVGGGANGSSIVQKPSIHLTAPPVSAQETPIRPYPVKLEQTTPDIPRSTEKSDDQSLTQMSPLKRKQSLDYEEPPNQKQTRSLASRSLLSPNGATTSSAPRPQPYTSIKGSRGGPTQPSGTSSTTVANNVSPVTGSLLSEIDNCAVARGQSSTTQLSLITGGGRTTEKVPSIASAHGSARTPPVGSVGAPNDGGWSAFNSSEAWADTPRAERMSPIDDRARERGARNLQNERPPIQPAGDHWSPSPDRDMQSRRRSNHVSPSDRHAHGTVARSYNASLPEPTRKRRRDSDEQWFPEDPPPHRHRVAPSASTQETHRVTGPQARTHVPRSPSPYSPLDTAHGGDGTSFRGNLSHPDYPTDTLPRDDGRSPPYDSAYNQSYDWYSPPLGHRRLVSGSGGSLAQPSSVRDRPEPNTSMDDAEYGRDQGQSSLLLRMKNPPTKGSLRNDIGDRHGHDSYSPPMRTSQRSRGGFNRGRGNPATSKGWGRQQRPSLQDRISVNGKQNGKTSDLGARLS